MGEVSPEKYRRLIDSIDGIVWEANPDFTFTFVSKQAERILGYPVERWLNEPGFWVNILHPEDRDWALQFCVEQTTLLLPHIFEYRAIAADGQMLWLRDMVTVTSHLGRPSRLSGIMVDITSLRVAEAQLIQSEQRFRSLADAAFDGMVIHDGGKILVANLSEARMFGYEVGEIEGMKLTSLVPPESLPSLAEKLSAVNEAPFEILCVRKNGSTFWAEVRSREAFFEGKSVRVSSIRDVTERRRWEEQKELAMRQERQARLEAEKAIRLRDDFLAIASHELKTPLTPLKLDLQIQRRYLRELDLPHSRKTELLLEANEHAGREYQRLARLIDDLLDTSRIAAGRLPLSREETDLSDLVIQTCRRFREILVKSGSDLLVEVQPGVIAWCDRGRIEQVLNNLLTNCQKYACGKPVMVVLRAAGNMARLQVKDQGIGIAEEFHPIIFDRFVRAVPIEYFGGLGLGLYIVKEIVEGHGGRIELESELEKGSAFTVTLPLRDPGS